MGDAYTWVYLDEDDQELAAGGSLITSSFPTQADAEAWFADTWESLAQDGVAAVTLRRNGHDVYGPMSLEPQG